MNQSCPLVLKKESLGSSSPFLEEHLLFILLLLLLLLSSSPPPSFQTPPGVLPNFDVTVQFKVLPGMHVSGTPSEQPIPTNLGREETKSSF